MSTAPSGKEVSDLTADALDLPRFMIFHEPEITLEQRVIQGVEKTQAFEDRMVIEVFKRQELHGHIFTAHVERMSLYAQTCKESDCKNKHLDERVQPFLLERDVHLLGYDNGGVFRLQVPKFCPYEEAERKVKDAWLELVKMLSKKECKTPAINAPADKKEPDAKKPEQDVQVKGKRSCRHG